MPAVFSMRAAYQVVAPSVNHRVSGSSWGMASPSQPWNISWAMTLAACSSSSPQVVSRSIITSTELPVWMP